MQQVIIMCVQQHISALQQHIHQFSNITTNHTFQQHQQPNSERQDTWCVEYLLCCRHTHHGNTSNVTGRQRGPKRKLPAG